jgi:hypothetical protein
MPIFAKAPDLSFSLDGKVTTVTRSAPSIGAAAIMNTLGRKISSPMFPASRSSLQSRN